MAVRLKRNTFTNTEIEHVSMSAHLAKKFQARHNPVIEVNEFRFGQSINVDWHRP
jgi:hypothetical protein